MRRLVRFAVERRVTVTMTALAITAFGVVGYSRLGVELFPDISHPSLTVQTPFPDTAPQEIENLITRPVEEAVGVLRGLRTIHSVSRAGNSEVTLEFDWGSDMDLLALEVREKIDRIVLPEGAEKPIVLRFDPSLDPILRVALTGGDLGDMRYLAERRIKQDLETIRGVASARIKGGLEEEIVIELDQERLAALGIPLEDVQRVIASSNVNLPGGVLRGDDLQFLVRTVNEFTTVREVGELIVWRREGAYVRLREVADVYMGHRDREEITRVDGEESVEISIHKEGDANTVTVASLVRERLEKWRTDVPPGWELAILFDQSRFIRRALDEVRESALVGGLLAIAVLFFFLRDIRSTLIIATSIPLSVVATFVAMYRLDVSLNIMSLGGLTLGIGMLVDNSIVVLESIFRRREEGLSLSRSAVEGATEVGPAVVASTLTTVAVFLPIVFVEGIAGQLFRDQAITVTLSLLASLAVAVTVIPMLSAWGKDRGTVASTVAEERLATGDDGDDAQGSSTRAPEEPTERRAIAAKNEGFVSRAYDSVIRGVLRRPVWVVALALVLFALSVVGLGRAGTELIPSLTEGEFFFELDLPEGTSLFRTDRVVTHMERVAAANPAIERSYSTSGSRLVSGGLSLQTKAENLGQVHFVLVERSDSEHEDAVSADLRDRFSTIPDVELKFGRPSYFTLATPVELILYSEDLELLRSYSIELVEQLDSVPSLVDVRSSLEAGNPEVQIIFDRQRIAALGLDMGNLTDVLRSRVQGAVVTRFKEDDRQIDIRVRNAEEQRSSFEDIRKLIVTGADGRPLRLLTLASIERAEGPAEIHRVQQQRAAVITAQVEGASLGAAVERVRGTLAANPPPRGVDWELGGQNREMEVSFQSLRFATALAVFLVYLVMASIFESFLHPFLVLFTVPLGLIGVAAGLLATGTTISVIVLIGGVLLVGIIVNNAIVLIDTINRYRREGVEKIEAIARAGHVRLRPILMTTATTILGLLPLALATGEGAELRAPLAITVASGLFFGTVLTLVVIPAAYALVPSRVRPVEVFDEDADSGDASRARSEP